jgi:hypothetical protein
MKTSMPSCPTDLLNPALKPNKLYEDANSAFASFNAILSL